MGRAEQDRARRKPPESLDAWEAYQQGMYHFHRHTSDNVRAAKELFERAISIDPEFALAHAGYARTYYWNVLLATTEGNRGAALAAARTAVDLDPDEAEGHLALGHVHFADRETERAIPACETAIRLNPSYAQAFHLLGTTLVHAERMEEALPYLLTAIRLSPRDEEIGLFHARVALALLYLRRHEEAVDWACKAVRLPAIQWPAHCFLVAALAHLDRMEEASDAVRALLEFRPGTTLGFIRDHYPGAGGANFDHLMEGLRKAGLPE